MAGWLASPAIVDPNRGDFKVFETGAILLYLAQHYDQEHKFSFDPISEADHYSEAMQWIFFSHGGIGRTSSYLNFNRLADESLSHARTAHAFPPILA
jgi:glutathione S-transferase